MSVATDQLAQYVRQIDKKGQWVAIRRYTGTTVKTYVDTPTRGYVLQKPAREFVGAVVQNYLVAVVLVDDLADWNPPVGTRDKLMVGFSGFGDISTTPPLNEEGHVSSGKEWAINSAMPRTPGGLLIAIEIHAVG